MYYKYRSLENFKFLVDIFINNRLYCSEYQKLNDPMEGHYYYNSGKLNKEILNKIKSEKEQLKICSLSKDPANYLMWSHYGDGHKGIVIGLELNSKDEVREIIYDGLFVLDSNSLTSNSAIDILSKKNKIWEYEKEVRVFVRRKNYTDIKICKIFIGEKMSSQDEELVKKLINYVDKDIQVIRDTINYFNE